MSVEPTQWHWRDNMRPARFIIFDARAALFIIFVILRLFSIWTWTIFISALIVFYILERLGLTFEAALRKLRASICGKKRPAYIWTASRRMIDHGTR